MNKHNKLGEILATAFLGLQVYGAFEKDKNTFIEPVNLAQVIAGFISIWHPAQIEAAQNGSTPDINGNVLQKAA